MEIRVKAKRRTQTGKSCTRKLRRAGLIPAVIYAPQKPGMALTLDRLEASRLFSGRGLHQIWGMDISDENGEQSCMVMCKNLQRDPITGKIEHIDFYEILAGRKLTTSVPLVFTGKPFGVIEQGGAMQSLMREIEIRCLPDTLPEYIEVNVEHLHIGQNLAIRDIVNYPAIEFLADSDRVIVTVSAIKEIKMTDTPKEEVESAATTETPSKTDAKTAG